MDEPIFARPEPDEESELFRLRHTAAHVMAQAVLELFPDAKLGIGPPIVDGFYYDFDLGVDEDGRPRTFNQADLDQIEKRMRQIIAGDYPLTYRVVTEQEARELFRDQPYKLEIIDGLLQGEFNEYGDSVDDRQRAIDELVISTYRQDTFEDLCKGPHVDHTGLIPVDAFELTGTAAAYWRGDTSRPMLQRIYGTAWQSKKDLKRYLQLQKKRASATTASWGANWRSTSLTRRSAPDCRCGCRMGRSCAELEKLAHEMEDAAGYVRVATPHIARKTCISIAAICRSLLRRYVRADGA
ncbi:MAG: hypothetical protein R3C44_17410 [Chloroflexota bacterium]